MFGQLSALTLGTALLGSCGEPSEAPPALPPDMVDLKALIENPSLFEGKRVTFSCFPAVENISSNRESCDISVNGESGKSHKDIVSVYLRLSIREDHQGGMLGIVTKKSGCNKGIDWDLGLGNTQATVVGTVRRSKEEILFVDIEGLVFPQ